MISGNRVTRLFENSIEPEFYIKCELYSRNRKKKFPEMCNISEVRKFREVSVFGKRKRNRVIFCSLWKH